MKNLNILKKTTLLVNSFKCYLVKFFYPNQEFINVINAFFVYCFIIVLSSCSGSEFLKRKYTSGKFTEHKKSLKHNTVYADTNTNYTSLSVRAEFKKATTVLESFSEEEQYPI